MDLFKLFLLLCTITSVCATDISTNATTNAEMVQEACEGLACEQSESWSLALLLCIFLCIVCLVHFLLNSKYKWIPESFIHISVGVIVGGIIRFSGFHVRDVMSFDSESFFLILLPPIIFESGYSLHKGNFFSSIGSILVFSVLGTFISAIVVGFGLMLTGYLQMSYILPVVDCFIFGSLISAIDPVATLAIFKALNLDPALHMMIFGESVLNDAVSIVLFRTFLEFQSQNWSFGLLFTAFLQFILIMLGSIVIGVVFGLLSAFILKHIELGRYPSLELSFIVLIAYFPYVLAEGLKLSGIMAVLFTGIIMSHYTYFNMSSVCQATTQTIFRSFSFLAETCVFVYLGLALFTFKHSYQPSLIVCSLIIVLIARALNVFPLSKLVNKFRTSKISFLEQFIIWFSGLRGAIAFALALNFPSENRPVILTTTLIVVLFTIILLGGGTWPVVKLLMPTVRRKGDLDLRKTVDLGAVVSPFEMDQWRSLALGWMDRIDHDILTPFFTKPEHAQIRLQSQDLMDFRTQPNGVQHHILPQEDPDEKSVQSTNPPLVVPSVQLHTAAAKIELGDINIDSSSSEQMK